MTDTQDLFANRDFQRHDYSHSDEGVGEESTLTMRQQQLFFINFPFLSLKGAFLRGINRNRKTWLLFKTISTVRQWPNSMLKLSTESQSRLLFLVVCIFFNTWFSRLHHLSRKHNDTACTPFGRLFFKNVYLWDSGKAFLLLSCILSCIWRRDLRLVIVICLVSCLRGGNLIFSSSMHSPGLHSLGLHSPGVHSPGMTSQLSFPY